MGLTEEETIGSAKYLPRELPPRLFEEERFLFPETYGVDRVRLLVKDPEWLFAYWDVAPRSWERLRADVGERTSALSRLTLRVSDVAHGGTRVVLLPPGARSWYVRTDSARRAYRAELGFTLPSGEFRWLAESNPVVTPRVGASPEWASRRVTFREAREISRETAVAAGVAEARAVPPASGPWAPPSEATLDASVTTPPREGGASDVHRR